MRTKIKFARPNLSHLNQHASSLSVEIERLLGECDIEREDSQWLCMIGGWWFVSSLFYDMPANDQRPFDHHHREGCYYVDYLKGREAIPVDRLDQIYLIREGE